MLLSLQSETFYLQFSESMYHNLVLLNYDLYFGDILISKECLRSNNNCIKLNLRTAFRNYKLLALIFCLSLCTWHEKESTDDSTQ